MTTESDMRQPTGVRVYFGIMGDFDAQELSEFLGMTPTKAENAGGRGRTPKSSYWQIGGDEEYFDGDLYPLIECVIQRVKPAEERIIAASKRWDLDCTLQFLLRVPEAVVPRLPALGLDADSIRFLAKVNARIDIDS
jgi:hypothetical protein